MAVCGAKYLRNLEVLQNLLLLLEKAQKIYANGIQRLYDAAAKLASYKQTNHDMTSFVAQIQSTVEELNMLLDVDSMEEMKRKHDNLYIVLALRDMNSNFDHIRDQILTGQEVPSMDSLMTRLLRVPTPRKIGNSLKHFESLAMVSTRGRGDRGNCGGRRGGGGRNTNSDLRCSHCKKWGHTQDKCYYIIGWPDKTANVTKSETLDPKFYEEEYKECLR